MDTSGTAFDIRLAAVDFDHAAGDHHSAASGAASSDGEWFDAIAAEFDDSRRE